jgi:hypothetical protein
MMSKEGIKYDSNKPRLAEMIISFREALTELCKVYEFGLNKYGKDNFRELDNGKNRYLNAFVRHMVAEKDNPIDEESGIRHSAHMAFNALAYLFFDLEKEE